MSPQDMHLRLTWYNVPRNEDSTVPRHKCEKMRSRRGSALSPFLFAVVMDTVSCRIREGVPHELLYADDIAISAESEERLQERIWWWQEELERKGLKVNARKTEVLVSGKEGGHQTAVKDRHNQDIKQADKF